MYWSVLKSSLSLSFFETARSKRTTYKLCLTLRASFQQANPSFLCFFVINKPNCMFSRKKKDKYH